MIQESGFQSAIASGLATAAVLALVASCSGNIHGGGPSTPQPPSDTGGGTPPSQPFEALSPPVYVAKVKNLLTGLPPTDTEVGAVVADPTALRGLIDQWMAQPGFRLRMLDFFRNAFQQNQIDLTALQANINANAQVNDAYVGRLTRNVMDSFPLTVWDMVQQGRPFNETVTTNRYMLTTALMSYLSSVDDAHVSDDNKSVNHLLSNPAHPNSINFDSASTLTLEQSLASATHLPDGGTSMTWKFGGTPSTNCTNTVVTVTGARMFESLRNLYFGKLAWQPCPGDSTNTQRFAPEYLDSDWTDWRMVTVDPSPRLADGGVGYAAPVFYDLPALRAATTLKVTTQRIGFFGTLAFGGNWGTNPTNEMRVTANQTLIVAIGRSINGENSLVDFPVTATEADHASNPACYGCHSQLDPYKQFFRQSYTLSYHDQADPKQVTQPAGFSIGISATGQGVGDLSRILSTHPRFALAWVLKLHSWANSTAAEEDDPEVQRIATAFESSNFDFKTLVRELFSSPLITFNRSTKTTQDLGVVMSVARRDQFCAALSSRLGLDDICGATTVKPSSAQAAIASRALMMPVDTYYRALALPSLPTDPNLFYRASVESLCTLVANQVVDASPGPSRYTGGDPTPAISDLVTTVMGLPPSDPRAAQATTILTDNFNAARTSGASATDSLKSTFTLACISPSSVLVGQ